jgi:hypothetical protein
MILDMIQGCWYLRRSTDRWLLSKNSTTRLEGLESWHGAGLLWNCSIPITNTKGPYLYPCSNTTPSRPRLQHLLPKTNNMMSCRFRVHHQPASFFISGPRHHAIPNVSAFSRGKTPFAEWWRTPDRRRLYRMCWRKSPAEWYSLAKFGPHVSLLLYQFLVLTASFCCHKTSFLLGTWKTMVLTTRTHIWSLVNLILFLHC